MNFLPSLFILAIYLVLIQSFRINQLNQTTNHHLTSDSNESNTQNDPASIHAVRLLSSSSFVGVPKPFQATAYAGGEQRLRRRKRMYNNRPLRYHNQFSRPNQQFVQSHSSAHQNPTNHFQNPVRPVHSHGTFASDLYDYGPLRRSTLGLITVERGDPHEHLGAPMELLQYRVISPGHGHQQPRQRTEYMEAYITRHTPHGSGTDSNTRAFARANGFPNDDAGHILANSLGGSGTDIRNIFPQIPNINRGRWSETERMVREMANQYDGVIYSVKLLYHNSRATRPNELLVEMRPCDRNGHAIISGGHEVVHRMDLVNPENASPTPEPHPATTVHVHPATTTVHAPTHTTHYAGPSSSSSALHYHGYGYSSSSSSSNQHIVNHYPPRSSSVHQNQHASYLPSHSAAAIHAAVGGHGYASHTAAAINAAVGGGIGYSSGSSSSHNIVNHYPQPGGVGSSSGYAQPGGGGAHIVYAHPDDDSDSDSDGGSSGYTYPSQLYYNPPG